MVVVRPFNRTKCSHVSHTQSYRMDAPLLYVDVSDFFLTCKTTSDEVVGVRYRASSATAVAEGDPKNGSIVALPTGR